MCLVRGCTMMGVIMVCSILSLGGRECGQHDSAARTFAGEHDSKIRPIEIEVARAWWNANTTGKDEDFAAKEQAREPAERSARRSASFPAAEADARGQVDDPVLARQIEVLYLQYLEKQVDPALLKRITAKANAIEKAFNVYRAKVGDKSYTDSEVRQISAEVQGLGGTAAGLGGEQGVGADGRNDLRELLLLRNEAARSSASTTITPCNCT